MKKSVNNVLIAFGFTFIIALSAQISIAIEPVPLTFQTLAIFITALLLPIWHAFLAVIFYIVLGAIGLPVFANGGAGFNVITGPTGGFILAFPIVVLLLSILIEQTRMSHNDYPLSKLFIKISMFCGVSSILLQIIGILWGKYYTGATWQHMYSDWLQPFFLNMILKAILATLISIIIWKNFPLPR